MQKKDLGKILAVCITVLFVVTSFLPSIMGSPNTAMKFKKLNQMPLEKNIKLEENTLITDGNNGHRVIQVDINDNIVWEKTGLNYPADAERLCNCNTLITEWWGHRVIEVDFYGNIIWEKTGLKYPADAERLNNGNTLITEFGAGARKVIEVDINGSIVWQKTGLDEPLDAERLNNGNTLITEQVGRVIEVDSNGNIVWEKTGLNGPFDAERLNNGNTLITEQVGHRVIEVDSNGNIVWQKTGLDLPLDAERLNNGNTLICERSGRVIEVDSNGNIVWEKTGLNEPVDAKRIFKNQPPDKPNIHGPTSLKVNEEGTYKVSTRDNDNHQVYFYIDWGDGNITDWDGPYDSPEVVKYKHTWSAVNSYIIKVKATDIYDCESEWTEFDIKITNPRTRTWMQFLDMFPILQKILNYIL